MSAHDRFRHVGWSSGVDGLGGVTLPACDPRSFPWTSCWFPCATSEEVKCWKTDLRSAGWIWQEALLNLRARRWSPMNRLPVGSDRPLLAPLRRSLQLNYYDIFPAIVEGPHRQISILGHKCSLFITQARLGNNHALGSVTWLRKLSTYPTIWGRKWVWLQFTCR